MGPGICGSQLSLPMWCCSPPDPDGNGLRPPRVRLLAASRSGSSRPCGLAAGSWCCRVDGPPGFPREALAARDYFGWPVPAAARGIVRRARLATLGSGSLQGERRPTENQYSEAARRARKAGHGRRESGRCEGSTCRTPITNRRRGSAGLFARPCWLSRWPGLPALAVGRQCNRALALAS